MQQLNEHSIKPIIPWQLYLQQWNIILKWCLVGLFHLEYIIWISIVVRWSIPCLKWLLFDSKCFALAFSHSSHELSKNYPMLRQYRTHTRTHSHRSTHAHTLTHRISHSVRSLFFWLLSSLFFGQSNISQSPGTVKSFALKLSHVAKRRNPMLKFIRKSNKCLFPPFPDETQS